MNAQTPLPPPPGIIAIEDDRRFAPITFERIAGGLVAKLGNIEIGSVDRVGTGLLVAWSSRLPDGPRMRPAPTPEAGRDKLIEFTRAWFIACGNPLPNCGDNDR